MVESSRVAYCQIGHMPAIGRQSMAGLLLSAPTVLFPFRDRVPKLNFVRIRKAGDEVFRTRVR
jgi:hypothetical protein